VIPGMDQDCRAMISMFEQGSWGDVTANEASLLRWRITDRMAQVEAGARRAPKYWNDRLQEIDPFLRIRWAFDKGCWCVERWVKETKAWTTLKFWMNDDGPCSMDINFLCYILKKNDMQRVGAENWLKKRRQEAEYKRVSNDKANTAKVEAAVDSLSTKQVENFVAVERAIQTGETITAHGGDFRFVDLVRRNTKEGKCKVPRVKSLNPGMHPLRYKRDYKRRAEQ
jgi:hypothetical protein